jgi:hypothetical protein
MTEIRTTAEAVENAILPDARVALAESGGAPTAEEQPLPPGVGDVPIEQKSPAQWAYERIVLYIRNFEEQLDADQEVAMGFAGSDAGVLRIMGIGFFAPDIITFYGRDDSGAKTQLIQHVSQLNVLLRALPKEAEGEATRIGFRLARALEEGAAKQP